MIIVDFSAVAVSECLALLSQDKNASEHDMQTVIMNKIGIMNQKFKHEYGEMIISYEGKGNWRKDIFPLYKQKRQSDKETSTTDWDMLYRVFNKTKSDFMNNFQFMNIQVLKAESDDNIAVLSKGLQEKIMIISRDSDFAKLHCERIKQYDFVTKKNVKAKYTEYEGYLRGSTKESIANVRMPIDHLINGEGRQKPISKKFVTQQLTEAEETRYNENRSLMDFELIPDYIQDNINEEYHNQKGRDVPSIQSMRMWLAKNNFRSLARNVEEFVNG